MNDLTATIILSASAYVAFLIIGVVCLIWYNRWNRRKMERIFSTDDEVSSAKVEQPEARLESGTTSWDGSSPGHPTLDSIGRLSYTRSQRHRASSMQSLSESAIHDIYQGRRESKQLALVEDSDKNNAGFTMAGRWLKRAFRRRDSWER